MMNRSLLRGFAAATLSFALIAAACGGDDDDGDENDANGSNGDSTAAAEGTANGSESPIVSETRASAPTRIAATAVPSDGAALVVANPKGQIQFVPTADEFRAMEKTTVDGQEGVSLATLQANAAITEVTLATIEGSVAATGNLGSIRYPLTDMGSTIFVMDDRGHITIASDTIPEAERLTLVTSIVFE